MKILIIGLGNPILGDDGVGWRIAEEVRNRLHAELNNQKHIEVEFSSLGGLSLMELLIGYDRAIIVDAITTGQYPPGTVLRFPLSALPNQAYGHLSSTHDTNLQTALELGRSMGVKLPNEILVIAVEIKVEYNFSEELTPAVAKAVPKAAQWVISSIASWKKKG